MVLQIYLGEHFCVGGELIKTVYYWDNKNGTSTWKRLKDIKKINTFIRVHRNMKMAEKVFCVFNLPNIEDYNKEKN